MDALTHAQVRCLEDVAQGRMAVVWERWRGEQGPRGLKPWYALTCGHKPSTVYRLWLEGHLRCEAANGLIQVEGDAFVVARARLTPQGRRTLRAERDAAWVAE